MNKNIKEIDYILKNLIKNTHINQVVIVDQNGLPIASLNKSLNKLNTEMENKISALTASVFLLSEKTSNIFNQGIMEQMIIKNRLGKTIITNINQQSLIILVLEKNATSESIILLKLKNAIKELKKLDILNQTIEDNKDMDFFIPNID
ncbi:MAG: hypothetical protein GF329_18135 [Candidatus Lokiarchaeota archaeon]|nr:hypothetical protein [Candidatus Lokiarchaeota archaeon]